MRRRQLFEILDQPWCPQPVRDGATDFLETVTSFFDLYSSVREKFLEAIRACRANRIVDLCSGGGGPWLSEPWQAFLEQQPELRVLLTDKFPSRELCLKFCIGTAIAAIPVSVDAANVPGKLSGTDNGKGQRSFRTVFSSFHHFSDENAVHVLADAVRSGQGFASAEITQRRPRAVFLMCLLPLLVWALTPRVRPFHWSRLFLTYIVPAIPFVVCFDGIVSCLRTRTPEELLALTERFPEYAWSAGYGRGRWLLPVYLIGVPR